jgi:hypothetical protein
VKRQLYYTLCGFFILMMVNGHIVFAQSDTGVTIKIAAGPEYKRSGFYQSLWGHNYRKEWYTPVKFPVVSLDTLAGGLRPVEAGGGHQSMSLHLKNAAGHEYALRSVDKTLSKLVPPIFQKTFVEHIIDDAISASNPYGAVAVPGMAKAAGIYYTNPVFYYVPSQPALDTFSKYGNHLYLFEERPTGDLSDRPNLGAFTNYINSEKMLDKMYGDNNKQVDQKSFAKARLFDFMIGDWDRHLEQWKWGVLDSGKGKTYVPVPTDRDQAFFKYDGLLFKAIVGAAGMAYLKSFDHRIKSIGGYSYERRNLDRLLTNRLTIEDWNNAAIAIQNSVTDAVIDSSVHWLPAEVFAFSGNDIIAKLRSRRDHLKEYAGEYYEFLAREVEVVGSDKAELFVVENTSDGATVKVYDLKHGEPDSVPYYSRSFKRGETKEVRLFGLAGANVYRFTGSGKSGIRFRVIGGTDKDSVVNLSQGRRLNVYDDKSTVLEGSGNYKLHPLADSIRANYNYDTYLPDKRGLHPVAGYGTDDRIYVGLAYSSLHHKWNKLPYASKQNVQVNYSISQSAFDAFYDGLFPNAIGKYALALHAGFDAIKWQNFYGLGNETIKTTKNVNYYRMRFREGLASIGINRYFGKHHTVALSTFFQNLHVVNDTARFLSKTYAPVFTDIFDSRNFVGARLAYTFVSVNDSVIPTKGLALNAAVSHSQNLTTSTSFQQYSAGAALYIPLFSKFSIFSNNGISTVTGTPEFYQYPTIGAAYNLRGYTRERFAGKTAFYNSNELRFVGNVKGYWYAGKIGLLGFFDQGRVWMPGESSNVWHYAYGGGILLAPFNLVAIKATYGFTKEGNTIQLRMTKFL